MLHDGDVATFNEVLLSVRTTIFYEQQVIDECTSNGRRFEHRETNQANATTDYWSKGADGESKGADGESEETDGKSKGAHGESRTAFSETTSAPGIPSQASNGSSLECGR